MFPKAKLRDKKAIEKLKKEHKFCEMCGHTKSLEVAHIISKGAGGPDMLENMVVLCGPAACQQGCHGLNHAGKLSSEQMFYIAARREKITTEECRKRVRRRMGYNV